jgi:hypothetical protein
VQPGIEAWIMKYQKYCNSQTPGRAIFYGEITDLQDRVVHEFGGHTLRLQQAKGIGAHSSKFQSCRGEFGCRARREGCYG